MTAQERGALVGMIAATLTSMSDDHIVAAAVYVGVLPGGSIGSTADCAEHDENGRLEIFGSVGEHTPDLLQRGGVLWRERNLLVVK